MADRIEEILEKHLAHLHRVTTLMHEGRLSTRTGNEDTTAETIKENLMAIADLGTALQTYRTRNA